MSKSLLVIDTPKSCIDCPLSVYRYDEDLLEVLECSIDDTLLLADLFRKHKSCPLIPLGKRVEEYELETWTTRDGIFLCEKGLFNKMYGDEEE